MANKSWSPYKHSTVLFELMELFEFLLESSLHCLFLGTYRGNTVWSLNWSRTGGGISIQWHNFFCTAHTVQQQRCCSLWWFSIARFSGKITGQSGKRSVQKELKKQVRKPEKQFLFQFTMGYTKHMMASVFSRIVSLFSLTPHVYVCPSIKRRLCRSKTRCLYIL